MRIATVTFFFLVGLCVPAAAQAQAPLTALARVLSAEPAAGPGTVERSPQAPAVQPSAQTETDDDDLKVSIYPVLVWVPAFTATTVVPAFPDRPDGPDLPGQSGTTESTFDGAYLAGASFEKANWRIDVDGIWAALVTTRERPLLNVDLDLIYGHVSGGVKIYKDLYVTGGVRRVALKYDIELEGREQHFIRKPGIWDPLVGLGWHGDLGSRWTLHVTGEGGGFGAGADVDLAGGIRADLKLTRHFGLTAGYHALYLKLSDTVLERTFEVKQTLHGPIFGLGLYF